MEIFIALIILAGLLYGIFWMFKAIFFSAPKIKSQQINQLTPYDLKALEESAARLMTDLRKTSDECVEKVRMVCKEAEIRMNELSGLIDKLEKRLPDECILNSSLYENNDKISDNYNNNTQNSEAKFDLDINSSEIVDEVNCNYLDKDIILDADEEDNFIYCPKSNASENKEKSKKFVPAVAMESSDISPKKFEPAVVMKENMEDSPIFFSSSQKQIVSEAVEEAVLPQAEMKHGEIEQPQQSMMTNGELELLSSLQNLQFQTRKSA
ncbi:MAG: hypothetical protein SNJ70_00890 [Armatimonadota bacterium]